MPILLIAVPLVVAYLLGSIPMGVIVTRLVSGVEVRAVGSGRTGATNVYRAAGPWAMALTSLGDMVKGIFAVWAARMAMTYAVAIGGDPLLPPWVESLAGVAAVAGHNWSVFLGFRGGAGTVTTIGALAALNIYVAVALTVVGLTAIFLSRMASIGSITVAVGMAPALAIAAAAAGSPWGNVSFGVLAGALTIYALIPNIKRILSGHERRLKTNTQG